MHISSPDTHDIQCSQAERYPASENIMIYGLPNGWEWLEPAFRRIDWTDGCNAVNNTDMREI